MKPRLRSPQARDGANPILLQWFVAIVGPLRHRAEAASSSRVEFQLVLLYPMDEPLLDISGSRATAKNRFTLYLIDFPAIRAERLPTDKLRWSGKTIALFKKRLAMENERARWRMKFANAIKWQLGLVALGASLLLASSSYAQQEMDPAFFETPAASADGNFNGVPQTNVNMAALGQVEYSASTPVLAAKPTQWGATEEASLTPVDNAATFAIIALLLLVVIRGVRESVRTSSRKIFTRASVNQGLLSTGRQHAVTT